MGTAYSLISAI